MERELGRRGLEQDGREQVLDGREQHDVHDVWVHDDHILLSMDRDLS